MDEKEIQQMRKALIEHKDQIEKVFAESFALQLLLVGLMNELIKNGTPATAIEEAFEYAASTAMVGTVELRSTQPTYALKVIDELRRAIVRQRAS